MSRNTVVYTLTMERYGNREGHHYILGLYSDLAVAVIEALETEIYRANKYKFRIEIAGIDSSEQVAEVPREVAINFAKMKFPDRFDDRGLLVEEVQK